MTVVAELKGPGKVNVLKADRRLVWAGLVLVGLRLGRRTPRWRPRSAPPRANGAGDPYLFLADLSVSHRTSVWILRRDARSCDAPSHVPVEPIHEVSPREISCADQDGTDCSVQQEWSALRRSSCRRGAGQYGRDLLHSV